MAYIINNAAGTVIATVADGTIDTTSTSLTILGKGFNNYGEIVAENWVKMIEHFSSATAPTNALRGQLWYDTTNSRMKINISAVFGTPDWDEIPATILNGTAPTTGFSTGALWYDTTDQILNITTDGSTWTPLKAIKTGTGGTPVATDFAIGDLFYDQDTKELKVRGTDLHGGSGAVWDVVGPSRYKGAIAPVSPEDGDEWWDSTNKQLFIYDGSAAVYRLIGPANPTGITETGQYSIIFDGNTLLASVVNDEIVGLWATTDFTPSTQITDLIASGTGGTITVGVPPAVVGPGRTWSFHVGDETGDDLDIKRGLNLTTVGTAVLHGTATSALYV